MKTNKAAILLLLLPISLLRIVAAQSPPALAVVPSKVTMLVGETHTFRAVGKDGHMRHNVRWSVSPERAASLTMDGDEATLTAKEPSSTVVLTACADGDSSEARVEIRSGGAVSTGTVLWSVNSLPGCKTTEINQGVPSANGPDLYVHEDCPEGSFIRAMTADGRELWRRKFGGSPDDRSEAQAGAKAPAGEHLNLGSRSFCDTISTGMTKEAISRLAQADKLRLAEKEQENRSWTIEEHGFHCTLLFDDAGRLLKKKKVIVTE